MIKAKRTDRWHWLIVKHITSRMEVFTTHLCGDGKALAVFSFEEEAESSSTSAPQRLRADGG
jgi:hypothetical protein